MYEHQRHNEYYDWDFDGEVLAGTYYLRLKGQDVDYGTDAYCQVRYFIEVKLQAVN